MFFPILKPVLIPWHQSRFGQLCKNVQDVQKHVRFLENLDNSSPIHYDESSLAERTLDDLLRYEEVYWQ